MKPISTDSQYTDFVVSIKQRILQSQYEALKAVNKELIVLYWDIGKSIVEKQETFGWGKSIVKNLAEDLQKEFVRIKGFSVQNLWNMRLFYLAYEDNSKLQTLSREIAWSHNISIIQKAKDDFEREFYIQMTKRYGWTYRVLINHIENKSYEKFLLNQTNFEETVPQKYKDQAKLAVRDDYIFDFLELGEEHSEKEIEKHNAQYAPIEVKQLKHSHDRFLLIDEKIYHLGASLKDLGKKWFAFSLIEEDVFELKKKIGEVLDVK